MRSGGHLPKGARCSRHDRAWQNTSPTVSGDEFASVELRPIGAASPRDATALISLIIGFCGTAAERSSLQCNYARIYTIRDAGGEDALPVGSFANAKAARWSREWLGGGGLAYGAHGRKSFLDGYSAAAGRYFNAPDRAASEGAHDGQNEPRLRVDKLSSGFVVVELRPGTSDAALAIAPS